MSTSNCIVPNVNGLIILHIEYYMLHPYFLELDNSHHEHNELLSQLDAPIQITSTRKSTYMYNC